MKRADIIEVINGHPSPEAYGLITSEEWANGLDRLIPQHMQNGVVLWVCMGILPGSFLRAVVENDLFGACRAADDVNQNAIFRYANFFHNYAPSECFGSPKKVAAWEKQGGLGAREE